MKGLLILGAALLYSVPAYSASEAFRDAFRAYVKVRQVEEQSRILQQQTGWDEIVKKAELRKLSAMLTEARIDFHAVLEDEQKAFAPWELATLGKVAKLKKNKSKDLPPPLAEIFPNARSFSVLEWQLVREWFGEKSQDAFLRDTFAGDSKKPEKKDSKVTVALINDPFVHMLPSGQRTQRKAEQQAARKQLEKAGHTVHEIALSLFTRMEDQAEELRLELMKEMEKGSFVIVSSGRSSAIVLRTFDLNPGLLSRSEIDGWINLNGQLYGEENTSKGRGLASITSADRQIKESQQLLLTFQKESLERQPPLSAKFPVVNLVSAAGTARPAKNLRENLIPEGKSFFFSAGNTWQEIKNYLP